MFQVFQEAASLSSSEHESEWGDFLAYGGTPDSGLQVTLSPGPSQEKGKKDEIEVVCLDSLM